MLHDVQGLGKESADKRQNKDANAADNLVYSDKCDHGKNKEDPVEAGAFFGVFHASHFVAQIYSNYNSLYERTLILLQVVVLVFSPSCLITKQPGFELQS
jgi:hypothetical protein